MRDLRISVTDRCNFRCVYCMSEDMTFLPKRDLLKTGPAHKAATRANDQVVLRYVENPNGSLDDIAIYNRALTADEILKIYNGTGF